MSIKEDYEKASTPVFAFRFPAMDPTKDELNYLMRQVKNLLDEFNDNNVAPIDFFVVDIGDLYK